MYLGCKLGDSRNCNQNPCDKSSCPSYPNAVCELDQCDFAGCKARFYMIAHEVTDMCGMLSMLKLQCRVSF